MTSHVPIVFLFGIDNTLLDNDQVIADLKQHLMQLSRVERHDRHWAIFGKPRIDLGSLDYLGALQRCRAETPIDPHVLQLSFYLLSYSTVSCLLPCLSEIIGRFCSWGPTVILSDGDVNFQPWKIQQSELYDAVEGRALIDIHKAQQLNNAHIDRSEAGLGVSPDRYLSAPRTLLSRLAHAGQGSASGRHRRAHL